MMTGRERNFAMQLRAAELHWFFVQGSQAARAELWLPSVVALLTGIENSVRVTVGQLEGQDFEGDPDLGATLSNPLLRRAMNDGLPISELAFPNESDFVEKLNGKTPYVEIVRTRHDLCHGNVLKWINRDLGNENSFFTPECVRSLAHILLDVSDCWVASLAAFRTARGL